MKNTTQAQRVQAAQLKFDGLKKLFEPMKAALDTAESELRAAKRSYDPGTRVHVVETCNRGCCTEADYSGVLVSQNSNGTWKILGEDGKTTFNYVSDSNFKVLG